MQFRPCIDIHNGAVKQIVGGSLKDVGNQAKENFVSKYNAAFYAKLYQKYSGKPPKSRTEKVRASKIKAPTTKYITIINLLKIVLNISFIINPNLNLVKIFSYSFYKIYTFKVKLKSIKNILRLR